MSPHVDLAWQVPLGRRAALYMRKTFSNVCRCGSWTSQTPIITAGRWQPRRLRGAYLYTL